MTLKNRLGYSIPLIHFEQEQAEPTERKCLCYLGNLLFHRSTITRSGFKTVARLSESWNEVPDCWTTLRVVQSRLGESYNSGFETPSSLDKALGGNFICESHVFPFVDSVPSVSWISCISRFFLR
jgi:hypothetical protein